MDKVFYRLLNLKTRCKHIQQKPSHFEFFINENNGYPQWGPLLKNILRLQSLPIFMIN